MLRFMLLLNLFWCSVGNQPPTHPPHPRMCLYYACVCIYMCVYIHTVYVYIYICSICNLWWSQQIPLKVVMSLPYYTLSSLGISNDPPLHQIIHFTNTTHCQFATNTEPNLYVLTRERNTSTKQLYSSPLFSFPVPADVRSEVTQSGPFKFLENVSLRLVLHKSSGSNILWNGNKNIPCTLDPKRTKCHAIWHYPNEHKT